MSDDSKLLVAAEERTDIWMGLTKEAKYTQIARKQTRRSLKKKVMHDFYSKLNLCALSYVHHN